METRSAYKVWEARVCITEAHGVRGFPLSLTSMSTSEEYLKCRPYHFSLGYAAKSYMIRTAQLSIILDNMCRVFIFTKNKFRKHSFQIKTLTLNTKILIKFL